MPERSEGGRTEPCLSLARQATEYSCCSRGKIRFHREVPKVRIPLAPAESQQRTVLALGFETAISLARLRDQGCRRDPISDPVVHRARDGGCLPPRRSASRCFSRCYQLWYQAALTAHSPIRRWLAPDTVRGTSRFTVHILTARAENGPDAPITSRALGKPPPRPPPCSAL
jgi:hypothetical protein